MPEYVKHLVECKCILPQFRKMSDPPFHKFSVFNEIEDDTGNFKQSYAQCPNCGAVHKVLEVGKSEILNKDTMLSLPTIEDLKIGLPDWLTSLLERHECDISTWQEAKFIYENEKWGYPVVLVKERDGDTVIGKYVVILGKELHKIETFERFDGFVSPDD